MRFLNLFIAAVVPVLKLLLITSLGSFLATDRVNILGPEARKHLNNVAFFVFNPSLAGWQQPRQDNNVQEHRHARLQLAIWWFMPVNIMITFVAGSMLGWIIIKITQAPNHLRGLVLGCCAAGNLGNMPLIIIPAICQQKGSPFGSVDSCRMHGLAYASLSMAIGAIYLWLYVYNLIRIYSTKTAADDEHTTRKETENLPRQLQDISLENPRVDRLELDTAVTEEEHISGKVKRWIGMKWRNLSLRRVFAPSTIGAIAGFAIGTVPTFREVMISDGAPLRVIQDSVSMLGDAAIPTVTVILGANLLRGLKGGTEIRMPVVAGIIGVRYLGLPLLGILVVRGATRVKLVPSDPLYQFILLLQFAVPPAMNIGTMTQLFGVGEKECSVIMLWANILASLALTFWSAFFMWLVS